MIQESKMDLFGEVPMPVQTTNETPVIAVMPKKRRDSVRSTFDEPFALRSGHQVDPFVPEEFLEFAEAELVELHETLLALTFHELVHNQTGERQMLMNLEWVLSDSSDPYSFRACCAATQEPYEVYRAAIFLKLGMDEDDIRAMTKQKVADDPNWFDADLQDCTQPEYQLVKRCSH